MGERIKALWTVIASWFSGLSTKTKAAIIFVGSALLVAKFRDVLIDLLVNSSKRILKGAQNQDAKLAAKENAANNQANALVDEAQKLTDTKPVVDENWNKK